MNSETPFRHELKYEIGERERASLVARLTGMIERDAHAGESGSYQIRSLYFDDYFGTAYADKIAGVGARTKYRIRCYNGDDALIRLERKSKRGNYISKQSAVLSRAECDGLIRGDYAFLLAREEPLCAEFYYETVTKILRPRVIVDYLREPFVYRAGDVRITFDSDVRALPGTYPFFSGRQSGFPATEYGKLILEVKYTDLLPRFIKTLLPGNRMQLEAFSKYAECCDALIPAGAWID